MNTSSSRHEFLRQHWPLLGCAALLTCTFAVLIASTLPMTGGHVVYALDDAYIHMAMAKNLALSGVYGVTPYEFSSSSSSPLWTLCLSLVFRVAGIYQLVPLAINFVLALTILVIADAVMRRATCSSGTRACALLAVTYCTPLPALAFSGMEHLMHILLLLLFFESVSRNITESSAAGKRSNRIALFSLSAALVLARYESYAILAGAVLLFLFRRQWVNAVGVLVAGVLPLAVYQTISVAHGWFWLPNSILLRTSAPGITANVSADSNASLSWLSSFVSRILGLFARNAYEGMHVTILILVACTLLLVSARRMRGRPVGRTAALGIFVIAALAHLTFGSIGHFFRYEGYLVTLGILSCVSALPTVLPPLEHRGAGRVRRATIKAVLMGAVVAFSIPLLSRGVTALALIPTASRNIYEQQYQMGTFARIYYPGSCIAVNDIGAVSFLGTARLVDITGLASVDVLRLKRSGTYTSENISSLCESRGARLAMVYDSWLERRGVGGIPAGWKNAGTWRIFDNVVCSDDIVSFYALTPRDTAYLAGCLRAYSLLLPSSVEKRGLFTEGKNHSDTSTTTGL